MGSDDDDEIYFGYVHPAGPLGVVQITGGDVTYHYYANDDGLFGLFGGEGNDHIEAIDGGDGIVEKHGMEFGDFSSLSFTLYQLTGGSGRDTLLGTPVEDRLYGGPDDDLLKGHGAGDYLSGEDGNDRLEGGAGNDRIHGGPHHDYLKGGDQRDALYGDEGNDRLDGGAGRDRLYGRLGDDYLIGSGGADLLHGEEGDDVLSGCRGDDDLYGGPDDDVLIGGIGLDDIDGGAGDDRFYCREATSCQPWYDPEHPEQDCDDGSSDRIDIEEEERRDPYDDWAHMVMGYKGATVHYFTTSAPDRLLADRDAGASILLDDGEPLHRVHKQYPSACGPASLAMVMDHLGLADPGSRQTAPRDLNHVGPLPPVGADWDSDVAVDLGYWLSPEHLMYVGLRRAYQTTWRHEDQRPSWWPKTPFISEDGLLNTTSTGPCPGTVDCGSFLQIDYELGNVQVDGGSGGYTGPVQRWLWHSPGVGGSNLVFVANTAVRDVQDTTDLSLSSVDLEYARAIIRAFVDHDIPIVVAVDNGGHFNTLMGYWDVPVFHVYTADPLDGWGRSCWVDQPMRWRRFPLDEATVQSSLLTNMMLYGYAQEGCSGPDPWAHDLDDQYGQQTLCGESNP
ncbi:MAG: calcium-binding protein [bacterium]|nr:calcium-binding protein [bacterium]